MKTMMMLAIPLVLSSCMHVGMMGAHGDTESGDHQTAPESVLEKEVEFGDVKATATFPSVRVGEEAIFSLKLTDKTTSQPVSNALVSFHTSFLHPAGKRSITTMHGESDSSHMIVTPEHAIHFEREVPESSYRGVYVVGFTPSQAGEYKIMFHVGALSGQQLEPEVTIETTRHPIASGESHGSMMTNRKRGIPEYVFMGGLVMGAVMIAVWAARGGHMF